MTAGDSKSVLVIGAGGHAKVVISNLRAAGYSVTDVYDDDRGRWGTSVLGVPVRGAIAELAHAGRRVAVIAIGDNRVRERLAREIDMEWVTVAHPLSYIHSSVRLGEGSVVSAGAIIQPDAFIGAHAIINTGATVDHDCVVGDFAHLAPGVRLAGGVRIAAGAFLGTGAIVIPCRSVGEWAVIGAGGVVVRDIPAGATAVGIPAKPLNQHS
ncbi:MAG TPA: acetyltransferase [Blastocatellia bacterium]|jgi:sugar O-acyltransferase (sialic acid O-acetyltransferase NeuD family)